MINKDIWKEKLNIHSNLITNSWYGENESNDGFARQKNFYIKLFDFFKLSDSGKLLDIGCGNCGIKQYLSKNIQYVGIDPLSGEFNRYNGVKGDSENLPFENESFDMAIMNDILDHVYDPAKAIGESYRILKNNGCLYISNSINKPELDHTINFDKDGLNELIINSKFIVFNMIIIESNNRSYMNFILHKELK